MSNDTTKISPDILEQLKIWYLSDDMVKMKIQKMNLEEEIKQLINRIKSKYA